MNKKLKIILAIVLGVISIALIVINERTGCVIYNILSVVSGLVLGWIIPKPECFKSPKEKGIESIADSNGNITLDEGDCE
ncbi:MAG: hypothetical protein LBR28_03840 [Bacteroidales bacterium]|jgi:hypothetical protein|nr:hypothetical protein [Bacteroidales bacterium]